jgi:hypothetical protein
VAGRDGIEPPTRGFSAGPELADNSTQISHLRRLPQRVLSVQLVHSAIRCVTVAAHAVGSYGFPFAAAADSAARASSSGKMADSQDVLFLQYGIA